jgi:hypothetical protein
MGEARLQLIPPYDNLTPLPLVICLVRPKWETAMLNCSLKRRVVLVLVCSFTLLGCSKNGQEKTSEDMAQEKAITTWKYIKEAMLLEPRKAEYHGKGGMNNMISSASAIEALPTNNVEIEAIAYTKARTTLLRRIAAQFNTAMNNPKSLEDDETKAIQVQFEKVDKEKERLLKKYLDFATQDEAKELRERLAIDRPKPETQVKQETQGKQGVASKPAIPDIKIVDTDIIHNILSANEVEIQARNRGAAGYVTFKLICGNPEPGTPTEWEQRTYFDAGENRTVKFSLPGLDHTGDSLRYKVLIEY